MPLRIPAGRGPPRTQRKPLLVELVSPNDLVELTLEGPLGHRRNLKPEMLLGADDLREESGEELAALPRFPNEAEQVE